MKLESLSKNTGKVTAKTLGAIKSAPKKTGNKTKSIRSAFVAGYQQHSTPKTKKVVEAETVIDINDIFGNGN